MYSDTTHKKLLPSALLILVLAITVSAQTNARMTRSGAGAPSGNCRIVSAGYGDVYTDIVTGTLYTCVGSIPTNSGTWTAVVGSGGGTYTFNTPLSESAGAVSIANAGADGSTKGAASFTAADFNASGGNISIDYTNGQVANGSQKGFLAAADWTTFNGKVSSSRSISTSGPLSGGGDLSSDRTISCPTCTTNSSALTSNVLVKGGGAQATQTSLATDDGTTLTYTGTGGIQAPSVNTGDGTIAGESNFYELSANGDHYRSWLSPDSLSSNVRFKFPTADPTAGQAMVFGAPDGTTKIAVGTFVTPATLTGTETLSAKTLTNPASTTQTLTDAATINWDANSGHVVTVTLGGNRTMAAPTNLKTGGSYSLTVIQDGTGSRTITWNSVFKWPGATAPTLTTTASRRDLITCVSNDGTNLLCNALLDVR